MTARDIYFRTLASIGDENSPAWKSTVAGLVVLRLIDDWLDAGECVIDVSAFRSVRQAIAAVPFENPIRFFLNDTVNALEGAKLVSIRIVAKHLSAYGRALYYEGYWELAREVFETLVQHADDSETLTVAFLQLTLINRCLSAYDEAEAFSGLAEEAALNAGDHEARLRSWIGLANIDIERGFLEQAEETLNNVLSAVYKYSVNSLLPIVFQELAHLNHLRGDFRTALRHGHLAMELDPTPGERNRVIANLASSFAELGYLTEAKEAQLVVLAGTREIRLCQQILINLMDIAALERDQHAFHGYRDIISASRLHPRMEAFLYLYSGRGYEMFGDRQLAMQEFQRAADLAAQYNLAIDSQF